MTQGKVTTTATLRPFGCELTTLSQADGSAIWKSGGTAVMASVHGPAAPRQASLEETKAQVSLVVAGRGTETNIASNQEEWEPLLRSILLRCIDVPQYPRSVVQIVCHVLSNDGSVLAACLHAAVAALMDAGIALQMLPTAVILRVVDKSDGRYHLSLDPDGEQEQDKDLAPHEPASALVFLVVAQSSSNDDKLTTLAAHSWGGRAPLDIWSTATGLAERARPALTNFMKMALQQKMQTRNRDDSS